LNERADQTNARRSLWHVDDGWAVFAGPLHHNDSHAHSAAVFLAGLEGKFRLRIAGAEWVSCRTAVIPAGVAYEFDVGGDPLGVVYLEPNLGRADALVPLVGEGREVGGALIGAGGEIAQIRSAFEERGRIGSHAPALRDLIGFAERNARRQIDQRIARVAGALDRSSAELVPLSEVAASVRLSVSRFQHLFTAEVGVPYRRYRAWHRLRAAIREIRRGSSYTAAAHAAGFADQAHFTRAFRRAFGAPPSRGL
jgi:AraC-like DNA-binding protein